MDEGTTHEVRESCSCGDRAAALTAGASVLAPPANAICRSVITTCSPTGMTELRGLVHLGVPGTHRRELPAHQRDSAAEVLCVLRRLRAPRQRHVDVEHRRARRAAVPSRLRMPTRDTYTWDERTLAGTIESPTTSAASTARRDPSSGPSRCSGCRRVAYSQPTSRRNVCVCAMRPVNVLGSPVQSTNAVWVISSMSSVSIFARSSDPHPAWRRGWLAPRH